MKRYIKVKGMVIDTLEKQRTRETIYFIDKSSVYKYSINDDYDVLPEFVGLLEDEYDQKL